MGVKTLFFGKRGLVTSPDTPEELTAVAKGDVMRRALSIENKKCGDFLTNGTRKFSGVSAAADHMLDTAVYKPFPKRPLLAARMDGRAPRKGSPGNFYRAFKNVEFNTTGPMFQSSSSDPSLTYLPNKNGPEPGSRAFRANMFGHELLHSLLGPAGLTPLVPDDASNSALSQNPTTFASHCP